MKQVLLPVLFRRLWKGLAAILATLVILLALLVGGLRLLLPYAPEYRAELEHWAGVTLGLPVRIARLDVEWAWFGPELVLEEVRVLGPQGQAVLFRADALELAFSLPQLARTLWDDSMPRPRRLRLLGPEVEIARTETGQWLLAGHALGDGATTLRDWRTPLAVLLQAGQVEIRNGQLRWRGPYTTPAGAALRLRHIELTSDGTNYQFAGAIGLPSVYGAEVQFSAAASGPAAQPEQWAWSAGINAEALKPQLAYRLLGETRQLQGTINLSANASGSGVQLSQISGELRAEQLALTPEAPVLIAPESGGMALDLLALRYTWHTADDGWRLQLDDIQVREGARAWPGTAAVLSARMADTTRHYGVRTNFVRLDDLAALARLLPPRFNPWHTQLLAAAPRGDVRDLDAGVTLNADGDVESYAVRAAFTDLGVNPTATTPGIHGLSGQLTASTTGGQLQLQAGAVQADFKDLFRNPLYANELNGTFDWYRATDGWHLHSSRITLGNADIAALTAQLDCFWPATGSSPVLDLRAAYRDIDFANKSLYLPAGIMPAALLDWLDAAVVSGHSPAGRLIARGPLDRFPWTDGSGLFRIESQLTDTVLAYASDWPRIEQLQGDLVFEGIGFEMHARGGSVAGLTLEQGQAGMRDMTTGQLTARATTSGGASQGVAFLRASPLWEKFGGYFDIVSLTGPSRAQVDLQLPIKALEDARVAVDVSLLDARAQVAGLAAPFTALNGTLHFTDTGVQAPDVTAQWLGAPVSARIVSDDEESGEEIGQEIGQEIDKTTRIEVSSRQDIRAMAGALDYRLDGIASGSADWQAVLSIPPAARPYLRWWSDLRGVAVSLPAPFGKPAEMVRHGELQLDFPAPGRYVLSAAYGPALRAWLALAGEPLQMQAGQLIFGGAEAGPTTQTGLTLSGTLAALDIDAWRVWWAARATVGQTAPAWPLWRGQLTVEQLQLLGAAYGPLQVQGAGDEHAIHLMLAGPQLAGSLIVPADWEKAPLRGDFTRLFLALPEGDAQPAPDPRDWPALRLQADALRLGDMALGAATVRTRRLPDGLAVDQLRLDAPSFTLRLTGDWTVAVDSQQTRIDFQLDSRDVAATLLALGYPTAGIEAAPGAIWGQGQWPASPFGDRFTGAAGELHLALRNGQLRQVEPGAGRLFGLLSLSALPRRLLLDFSDVFSSGLSFDNLTGDFVIQDGNAYTGNLQLDGPAADVLLVGRTGLAARDYDQVAVVDAHISAALPVAGALAAGPQVAAVVLLLSQLLKEPLQSATQTRYHITGPWDNPQIETIAQGAPLPAVPQAPGQTTAPAAASATTTETP